MSRNILSKEEANNQLYATIKTKFEQDGVIQEVRCLLQSKMIAMMKGNCESDTLLHPSTAEGDARMKLLHQLILEYFHWHGFHYSAEMLSMESSCENVKPMRQCLEGVLGNFDHKDLPILLELVATLMKEHKSK